ncbi:PAS domain S-box protein [Candidatus Peregrinibacteria bacterium]|jgi:PAS domain S-box-containing protein|nr:PAS domain S-box protein [Candidatus Peregrinibacteria bacterium]
MSNKPTYEELEQRVKELEQEIVVNGRDVTKQKHAEEALNESEKKIHDLYENAPDMFVSVCAKTGKILKCNRTTADTLEYNKKDILNRPIFDLYTKESGEYARKDVFPRFLKNGYIEGEELQLQKKNGVIITVLLKASSVRDSHGCIVESRSIWRDITKQKRAEIALQKTHQHLEHLIEVRTIDLKRANERLNKEINKSEEIAQELKRSEIRYKTVADFTYDWETWVDPNGNYIYVSPSCERISGYHQEEFIKDPDLIIKITHAADREKVMYHFKNVEHSKSFEHSMDFRITHKKGELVWISHACRSVHDPANNYLGRRGSNRDITEQKKYQIELEKQLHLPHGSNSWATIKGSSTSSCE